MSKASHCLASHLVHKETDLYLRKNIFVDNKNIYIGTFCLPRFVCKNLFVIKFASFKNILQFHYWSV